MSSTHRFVVVWDCLGLEYVEDITAFEQDSIWSVLKNETSTAKMPNLMHLRLRAQANPQRHYEIYFIDVEDGITSEDIRDMFEAAPQVAADTIREKGHRFYSDRFQKQQVKIV